MPNTAVGMTPTELAELMRVHAIPNANQLAKRLGVPQMTAWRWVNGRRQMGAVASALVRSVLTGTPTGVATKSK
jgi:DNA-binding transcriptional regulator YdaS (Cro superfamily)